MTPVALLFRLLVAHAVCDYALQSEFMADAKRPDSLYRRTKFGPWWWWALAHGFINGAGVYWATYSLTLGYLETLVHVGLDYAKCRGWLTTGQDQGAHLVAKGLWLLLAGEVR